MSLAEIIRRPLRRLNPHRGLVIDVPTWSTAHDYHRLHQRLHLSYMHAPGVVSGMDVVAWNPPDNTVVIYPGVAVDSEGNTVIVSEPQRFTIQTRENGTAYLMLRYSEVPEGGDPSDESASEPLYTLEGYTLEERRTLTDDTSIELARIQVSGGGEAVSDAASVANPGVDEIDLRHRAVSGPRPLGHVNVGLLPLEAGGDGEIRHFAGTQNLVRTVNSSTGYRAQFLGSVSLEQELGDCHLLLLAGQQEFSLDKPHEQTLRNFLARGGVIAADACGAGAKGATKAEPFRESFSALAERLERQLEPIERGHPLLTTHHIFGEPPEGVAGVPAMLADESVLFTDGDYGCLWAGGPEKPAPRASIRSAIELGVNLAVYAAQRVYLHSVKMVAQQPGRQR